MKKRHTLITEVTLVILAILALTVWFTWPVASDPGGFLHRGDPYLNAWILGYVGEQLADNPQTLFDAPYYYPHRNTLAYSENLIGMQPFFQPLRALSGSVVGGYNLLILLAFALNGIGMYLLVRFGFKLSLPAALLAALVFAFVHYRLDKVHHLHILWTVFIPLGIWLAYAAIRRNRWAPACGVAAVFLLQAYGSLHMLFYMAAILVVLSAYLLVGLAHWRAAFFKLAVTGLVASLLLVPLLLPYFAVRQSEGFERDAAQISGYAAHVQHLAAPSFYTGFPYPESMLDLRHPEKNLFIGFVALILLTVGVGVAIRRLPREENLWLRRGTRALMAAIVAALIVLPVLAITIPTTAPALIDSGLLSALFQFAPLVALVLLAWRTRSLPIEERGSMAAIALLIIGITFALGTDIRLFNTVLGNGPYAMMMNVPLVTGFRATARWFNVALPGIALLVAFGVHHLLGRRSWPLKTTIAAGLCLLCIWEYAPNAAFAPPRLVPLDRPSYGWLAEQPRETAVLELPLATQVYDETITMLAQLRHGRRLVNGYSGFTSRQFDRVFAERLRLRTPDGIEVMRAVPSEYVIVHTGDLTAEEKGRWVAFVASSDPSIKSAVWYGEDLVLSLHWGGAGTHFAMFYPREDRILMGSIAGRNLDNSRVHYADIGIDGRLQRRLQLIPSTQEFSLDPATGDPQAQPHELTVDYHYQLTAPETIGNREVPFRLHLETGGSDPNHCVVGINGRYLPREKGVNVYHIDSAGFVVETRSFNTAWYASAGLELVNWLRVPRARGDFLLIISRHHAAKNLGTAGREALAGLGLAAARSMKDETAFLLLVETGQRRPLLKLSGVGEKLVFQSPDFAPQGAFEFSCR